MKKFSFRLQKLLDIKLAKEKEVQLELAAEISKQNVLKEKQRRYAESVSQQRKVFHEKMTSHTDTFTQLRNFHNFSEFADLVIDRSQEEIDAMQPAIDKIRVRLNEAVKERRSIEKLKERKYEEWKYKVKRFEEREFEEINMKIHHRNKSIADTDAGY